MAIQLGLSPALGNVHERRHGDRRARFREAGAPSNSDRRRGDRRSRRLRQLLLSSLALAVPHQLSPAALRAPLALAPLLPSRPSADVSVSIDSFIAVPPRRAYDAIIREAAKRYGVDALLIRSVMQIESSFNPLAVSRAGAQGLMQLMPDLSLELGVTDPFDPRQNVMAGARYLRRLLDLHDGNVTLALASYNAGATNVARYGGVPPFAETRHYVARVIDLLDRARL